MEHHKYWILYIFYVSIVSWVSCDPNYFLIDLQKTGDGTSSDVYWDSKNNLQNSNIPSVVRSLTVRSNQLLAFDATKTTVTPVLLNPSNKINGYLCEQSVGVCPCGWFRAGSKCYFWNVFSQATKVSWPPSCKNGSLAHDYDNFQSNYQTIQQYHPLDCGPGYFRPNDTKFNWLCITFPKQADTWYNAEQTCLQNPRTGHILTFSSRQQSEALLTQYQALKNENVNDCNYGTIWLGYNRYAWNGNNYASTDYSTNNWISSSITGGGDCIQYDPNGNVDSWTSANCNGNNANFICLKDDARYGKCPSGWRYIVPFCYLFLNDTYSYDDGSKQCQTYNPQSNLPSFHSQNQWDEVNAYRLGLVNLLKYGTILENVYIGYASKPSLSWEYIDSSDPSYSYWSPAYTPPLNNGGSSRICAVSKKNDNYRWTVENDCSKKYGVLCMGLVTSACNDPSYSYIDGQCYKYLNITATTWDKAAIACNDNGGTLPIIAQSTTDGGQNDQWNVFQRWRAGLKASDNIWIGLTQMTQYSQKLQWMNRKWYIPSADNHTWLSGYPDSVNPYVVSSKSNVYRWTTVNDSVTANVICHLKSAPISCRSNFYQVAMNGNYFCYFPSMTQSTFGDGESFCRSKNASAHLLDYQNLSDYNTYLNLHWLFLAMKYPVENFWIGYSRGASYNANGSWVANHFGIPDVRENSSIWFSGNPNGGNNANYCARSNITVNGSWMDDSCSNTYGVICEADTINKFCPEGAGEFYGTNSITCYKLPSQKYLYNYRAAIAECKNVNANATLPSFHSLAEWQDFMRFRWTLMNTNRTISADKVWLGLSSENITTSVVQYPLQFLWQDGSNFNWSHWGSLQPDNSNNCVYSLINTPPNTDNASWFVNSCLSNVAFICQWRQAKLKNPCNGNFSWVGGATDGHCMMPVTWNLATYTHLEARMACETLNYTLPSFSSQGSWLSFVSWFSNMNQAYKWSYPVQSTWPMKSFWIGLTQQSTRLQWDDLVYYGYNNTNSSTIPPNSCFYVDSTSSQTWISEACTDTVTQPTLICQDKKSSRPMCNVASKYFLSDANSFVCYETVLQAPMNASAAIDRCKSSGGYLPSFHNASDWVDFVTEIQDAILLRGFDADNGIWIGLTDASNPFVWRWNNGMTYNWTNWIPYVEPSDAISATCVAAVKISANNWQWMRRSCDDNLAVMCQYRNYTIDTCSQGYSDLGNGGCFQIVPKDIVSFTTFQQSLFYCQSLNGTLPCFNDVTDWTNFLDWENNFATSANLNATNFWLGYQTDGTFSTWPCADPSVAFSFIPWSTSMPVNNGQSYCAASLVASNYSASNYDCSITAMSSLICKESNKNSLCPDNTWLPIGNATNQICYKTITTDGAKETRDSAITLCQHGGGHLPSFHSLQEFNDFNLLYKWYSEVRYKLDSSSGIWIGLNDLTTAFVWEWDDKSSYNWNYWDVNVEPSANISNRCILSVQSLTGQYVWRRESCNYNAAVICQIRVPPLTTTCLPGWSDIEGKCYRLWAGIKNLNSHQMKIFCQLNGGDLPSFDSETTWEKFLHWKQNTARGRNYNSSSFWLSYDSSNPWVIENFSNWTTIPTTTDPFCSAAIVDLSYSWTSVDCDSTFTDTAICIQNSSVISCPDPWVGPDNNRCFLQLNTSATTYDSAVSKCQTMNSTSSLPSFHTYNVWSFFNPMRWYFAAQENVNLISTSAVWIGATDENDELLYRFTDQSNFNWAFWKSGVEPTNNTQKNCVISPSLNESLGNWTTVSCTNQNTVICQWRPVPGQDPCGLPGWSHVDDRCYRIIPLAASINFYDANATCNQLNATLPSFDNSSQWGRFLLWRSNFANAKSLYTTDFWLGWQINNETNQIKWTDHNVTSYGNWVNWNANEPDDNQCAASSVSANTKWVAKYCYSTVPSLICQLIQYPVDCQMTDWVNSSCAQTCGNSTLESTRRISQINLNGGKDCPNEILVIYDCLDQIPCPIDCKDQYTEWTSCDCKASDDGLRYRKRTLLIEDKYNGQPCPPVVETETCAELSCWPMTKAERIAALVMQTFGCVWVLTICGMTFVLCIFFRIFSMERLFHAGQEICIMLTHFLVLFLREDVKHKTACTIAAAIIQFGTIGSFTFILMESIQAYCYATNVISNKNFLSWKFNLLAAILPPTAITLISSIPFYREYPAKYSCWLNIGNRISASTVIPVLACSLITVVILESAGMHDFRRLPNTNKKKYTMNKFNQRGLLFILPLNVASWAIGMMAIYYQNIAIFTLVFGLFIGLGVCIFIFHCLCHAVIYLLFSKFLSKLPCCKQKPSNGSNRTKRSSARVTTTDFLDKSEHLNSNVNSKDHRPNQTNEHGGVGEKQSVTPNHEPIDKVDTINDVGGGFDDSRKKKNQPEPDFFKDPEAWKRWVMDGRKDNMNQSENLLF